MNTQPPRQPEYLSDEERDLARVVRALPGGEPPAALDALILKAATDAVASSSHSPKNPRWTKAWLGTSALWLGTAAASILTVGIGWQLFQSMAAPIYELPDNENVMSRQEVDSNHKDDSVTVDMIPAREPQPTSPPPPELAETDAAADAFASAAPAEKPQAMKSEMRARENVARQEMADATLAKKAGDEKDKMRRDQAAESDWVPQTAGVVAASPMPAAAPPAPAATMGYSDSKELEAVTVTGSRMKRVDAETSQPVQVVTRAKIGEAGIAEDASLAPAQWLDAIKHRVERNDIEGAKASLKLYKQTHPKLRIPEELKPLLK